MNLRWNRSMQLKHLVGTSLLLACAGANGATIFSDNFEADVPIFNQTSFVGGWTVTNGTVDVVQNFVFPGKVVDLDGSTGDAGVFTKSLALTAGSIYTASFALAGSQRGSTETVSVDFGTASADVTLASGDPFGVRSLSFTPAASGNFALSFANAGGDNVGVLLDNVSIDVSPIPEPETYALMLAGLAGVGGMVRWRRRG